LEKAEKKIEAEETKSGKEIPQKTGADKEKREDK
jgi:hypothetical protein